MDEGKKGCLIVGLTITAITLIAIFANDANFGMSAVFVILYILISAAGVLIIITLIKSIIKDLFK